MEVEKSNKRFLVEIGKKSNLEPFEEIKIDV